MPTFPTYHGELPKRLNPLNLRHYFLLAYWVYFRPTALKCYLYQADPDLYRAGPGLDIFRTLRVPAYRSLYLMVPAVTVLFSVVIGLPITLVISWVEGIPINWHVVVSSIALGVASGIAGGVAVGLTGGVTFGVAGGVALSTAGSVAMGVAVAVTFTVAFSVPGSVVGSVASRAAGGMAGSIAIATVFGMADSVAVGVALGVAFSAAAGVGFGVASNIGGSIGTLRVPFYLLQLGPALHSLFRGQTRALEWDELAILPLPGTQRALVEQLQRDEPDGLRSVAEVARNPFLRWVAQAAMQSYLRGQARPLHFLYALLANPELNTYTFAPVSREDWEQLPSIKRLLLGELDRRWVNCSTNLVNRVAERLVWDMTRWLRDRRKTPLTCFAGMLYELLDEETVAAEEFDLSPYAEVYTSTIDYPGGEEIARSFGALAAFLSYNGLAALPTATDIAGAIRESFLPDAIRPPVLTTLDRLGQVGAEIATYRDATSRVNQLAALARATDALDRLDEYVVAEVMAPEQYILRRIARQWRRLVSEAGGEVGRAEEVGPVANPYVAGNPVTGDLFVGREDVLRRLEELWSGTGQKPSVVLYGHRRMGKSSILHNLGARFGPHVVVVDFNMQRVGLVESTGELLYNLALALYDAQEETRFFGKNLVSLDEPDEEHFTAHNPYTSFDRFLKRLARSETGQSGAGERRFIVTVDEFELIEALIAGGQLEPRLLDFWRGLIQTYPWFVMAFAGLHTLQEMTRDYWHPLFGSVIGIPVSFLGHDAAWRLVTQPTPDFPLDYDRDAVERIIGLTHGQPYLVQLIGHGLVTRFNRQTFEESIERERRFSLADVEAVINAPEFYRDGDAYFTGVWRQAETSEPPGQTAALRALAHPAPALREGLEGEQPVEEITRQAGLAPEEIGRALEALARHDVVVEEDGRWQFTVELMRRWVAQR